MRNILQQIYSGHYAPNLISIGQVSACFYWNSREYLYSAIYRFFVRVPLKIFIHQTKYTR